MSAAENDLWMFVTKGCPVLEFTHLTTLSRWRTIVHEMLTKRLISRCIRFRPAASVQRHRAVHYSDTVRRHPQEEERYIKGFRVLRRDLELLDKAQLQVVYELYDDIERSVRQVNINDVTPELHLQRAGPHGYINTTNWNGRKIRLELLAAVAELKLHLKDLMNEPYLEYDFDYSRITRTPKELEELDRKIRDRQDSFNRDAWILGKYINIIKDGHERKKSDGGFDLLDFFTHEVGRVKSEEAGVTFADNQTRPVFGPREKRSFPEPDQETSPPDRIEGGEAEVAYPKRARISPGHYSLVLDPNQKPSVPTQSRIRKVDKMRVVPEGDQTPITPKEVRKGAPKGKDSQKSIPKQDDHSDDFSDTPWLDHETMMEEDMKRR